MQNKYQYSNLVYEFFLRRIQLGYYNYGDLIPSIDTLCRELSVSAQTVKIALQRLRSEGYIDMHNGRSTKVIFEKSQNLTGEARRLYFSRRVSGFTDLYESTNLIVMPLLLEGFCRADREELAYLSRVAQGGSPDGILHFFCFLLQKLDNPLAMNLYWEISLFWGFIFLGQSSVNNLSQSRLICEKMQLCATLADRQDWPGLWEALQAFRRHSLGRAVALLAQTVAPAMDRERISFEWRIYRERPQVCYSLASRLLHEIYMGKYRKASLLPSYEKMAGTYGVSVSTVRRTVKALNHLGAVRSVNGTGTRIYGIGTPCDAPDFGSPAVRRNLAYFVQAFELLAYSCDGVMRDFLTTAAGKTWDGLAGELEENLAGGQGERSLWICLLYIARHSRFQGVREIYGRIYCLLLWGYPLKASCRETQNLERQTVRFAHGLLRSLKEKDIESCVQWIQEFVAEQFPAAEAYLLSKGFQPQELRLTPAIRLAITPKEPKPG